MSRAGWIVERVSLEDVRRETAAAGQEAMIFYGARTCWWTHDPRHLGRLPGVIPCDPRGGVLLQTDDVQGFLEAAEKNVTHYGRHGLRAFMAAHHANTQVGEHDERRTCFETWEPYNRLLDELDARATQPPAPCFDCGRALKLQQRTDVDGNEAHVVKVWVCPDETCGAVWEDRKGSPCRIRSLWI